jgi:hypothetical protein
VTSVDVPTISRRQHYVPKFFTKRRRSRREAVPVQSSPRLVATSADTDKATAALAAWKDRSPWRMSQLRAACSRNEDEAMVGGQCE